MAPRSPMPASGAPPSLSSLTSEDSVYTYSDLRKHTSSSDAWTCIDGAVYNITEFINKHPGGGIIMTSLGRDASVLFETHHNLVDNKDKVSKLLSKYRIGTIAGYQPVANYKTLFALELLKRVKLALKGVNRRDSVYAYTASITVLSLFFLSIYIAYITGSLYVAPLIGLVMALGHLAGHAGNHYSLSSKDWYNKFFSMMCTSLWGLREKNWEFSHLISHHCYNYTERDYILEQHVPLNFFRVRESDEWKPIHTYQHFLYLTTPLTAFIIGFLRLDCAPFIFLSPLLNALRSNRKSPMPAPQFFASGSNSPAESLSMNEDGVGPDKFVVFSTNTDTAISLFISNIVWLPLFVHTWSNHGLSRAVLLNGLAFGTQAMLVTKSLLTQHMCEDIQLKPIYSSTDDWYAMQVEASTTIKRPPVSLWLNFAISYQTEHHMFPSLNPWALTLVQPVVQKVAEEFKVKYHFLPSEVAAIKSVFRQFKRMAAKPVLKKE